MGRIIEFADAMPIMSRGRGGDLWGEIATELRAAGRKAAKLNRKSTGLSKAERARATAAGLRVAVSTKHGVWVELLDTPAPAGPPPVDPEPTPGAERVNGSEVTVAEFVTAYKAAKGNAAGVRGRLELTLGQFESLRAIARRDGLL